MLDQYVTCFPKSDSLWLALNIITVQYYLFSVRLSSYGSLKTTRDINKTLSECLSSTR